MSVLVDGGRSGDCIQIRNTFISISIRNTLIRLVSPDSVVFVCVCVVWRGLGVQRRSLSGKDSLDREGVPCVWAAGELQAGQAGVSKAQRTQEAQWRRRRRWGGG